MHSESHLLPPPLPRPTPAESRAFRHDLRKFQIAEKILAYLDDASPLCSRSRKNSLVLKLRIKKATSEAPDSQILEGISIEYLKTNHYTAKVFQNTEK